METRHKACTTLYVRAFPPRFPSVLSRGATCVLHRASGRDDVHNDERKRRWDEETEKKKKENEMGEKWSNEEPRSAPATVSFQTITLVILYALPGYQSRRRRDVGRRRTPRNRRDASRNRTTSRLRGTGTWQDEEQGQGVALHLFLDL